MQHVSQDAPALAAGPGRAKARRRGATMMEYLFMVSLIVIVAMTTIGYFGQKTANTMHTASDAISKATEGK